MATFTNATPRVVFSGIRDRSRRALIRPDESYAQHTPLLRLFTETGPETTTYVGDTDDGFAGIYGQLSLDPRSKFFNQQSLLALNLLGQGNGFYVKRLKPEDAGNAARIIVAIDMVRDMVPQQITRLSGFNFPTTTTLASSSDVVTLADQLVEGFRARITLIQDNTSEVGTQRVLPGNMTSSIDGTQSTMYPLFELPTSFFGALGDNLGARVWSPTAADLEGYDEATTDKFDTRLFNFQFVELMEGSNTPTVIKTALGEDYMQVSFDQGVWSESTDRDLYAGDVLIQAYEDDGISSGQTPLYSPFSQIYIYSDEISRVQQLIFDSESLANPAFVNQIKGPGQIDFLTMLNLDGDPYMTIQLEGALEGGVLLGKNATVFASGGDDGTTDFDEYVKLVDIQNTNFGQLDDQYEDVARYQFGFLYDTGLPMASKYKMMQTLAKRQDLICMFTTYIETDTRPLTTGDEVSRTIALMTRLKAFPESTLYGTPVARAQIVLQSGKLMAGGYSKRVPQLLDTAMKWAIYAGAGNGILRPGFEMDVSPNNQVTFVKGLNVPFFNARTASNIWQNGGTYSSTYDKRRQYYPCQRSVYLDDTSVLLSPLTVNICCVIMRLIHRVHAKFAGNATLSKEQLVARCDQEILDQTRDLFGARVDITPQTEITAADDQNGFSWTCTVTVAANNPRTVMDFKLETVRRETVTAGTVQ
ncbi:tail sheath [Pseudomonas phage 201phi2-1]|uniref:Tail sheath n=1 Tax=Pseudomonas phage 201phi2-1 TaxID=198110 RepID=B3FK06_BP201|nr:tail sheath [Pseudomonas phage 201phi2-1]ABY62864.1 tail sheath [Pseudomonas phage 201phi2-1]